MADKKPRKKTTYKGPSRNTVKVKQSEAETAKANAEAAKAASEAEAAKTRTRELELNEQRAAREAKEKRRQEDASPTNQITDAAKIAVPIGVGVAYGKRQANKIAAETVAINAKKAENLSKVAQGLREASDMPDKAGALIRDKTKLKAGVKTAAKLKLLNGAGKAGLGAAAILVAEGVAARVGAEYIENETMKEIVSGAGTGLTVAGGSLLATRALQRAGEAASVNAADAATVEAAKRATRPRVVGGTGPAAGDKAPVDAKPATPDAEKKPKTPRKPRDAASKKMVRGMSAAPATATGAAAMAKTPTKKQAAQAAYKAISGTDASPRWTLAELAKQTELRKIEVSRGNAMGAHIDAMMSKGTVAAGDTAESTVKKVAKAAGKGVLRALGPVAAGGAALLAMNQSSEAGETTAQTVARGVTAAADSAALGIPSMVADAVKSKETIKIDHRAQAREAQAAEAERIQAKGGKLTKAQANALAEKNNADDAMAAAKDVAVQLGAIAVGSAGGAAVMIGKDIVKEGIRPTPNLFDDAPSALRRVARVAGGTGMMVVGGIAAGGSLVALANRAKADDAPAGDGKIGFQNEDTLNAALDAQGKADKGEGGLGDKIGRAGAAVTGAAVAGTGAIKIADGVNPVLKSSRALSVRLPRIAGGGALVAAGTALVAAALSGSPKAEDAPAEKAKPRATGKNGPQRLNASQKAQLRQANASIEKARAAKPADPAAKPESDGFTDPHRRRGPNGQIVQVSGFRTTLPSR